LQHIFTGSSNFTLALKLRTLCLSTVYDRLVTVAGFDGIRNINQFISIIRNRSIMKLIHQIHQENYLTILRSPAPPNF